MIEPSPQTLLGVWNRAAELPVAQRGGALIALDARATRDVESWTLGRCSATLARIFCGLYGDLIEATVRCTACNDLLEYQTTIGALFGPDAGEAAEPGAFCIRHDGYELAIRPLQFGDLAALPPSPARAVECVLRRCVLDARRDGSAIDVARLPADVRDAIARALRDVDPLGEIIVALACAKCDAANSIAFDIAGFLWDALDGSASQLLLDVHRLASAYGWPECEILALPERRRRRYLELIAT